GPVVDVDAGDVEVGQRALQDDGEAVTDDVAEVRIVDAWAGDDEAVGAARSQQVGIATAVRLERLDDHPEATQPGSRGHPAQRLRQQGVAGDLLRRLAEDEADRLARPTGQLARRRMGMVTKLAGRIDDPCARRGTDRIVAPVEDERHGRARNAGPRGNVGAGWAPGNDRAITAPLR